MIKNGATLIENQFNITEDCIRPKNVFFSIPKFSPRMKNPLQQIKVYAYLLLRLKEL